MVGNLDVALQALHEVLVGARNMGLQGALASELTGILDAIEPIPVWLVQPGVDRTKDVVDVFRALGDQYPACRMAAQTASQLQALGRSC